MGARRRLSSLLATVLAAFLPVSGVPARAATKIAVTVIDGKTVQPVADLKAGDFQVIDGKSQRAVENAEFSSEGLIDVMLLVDTSLLGEAVQPLAAKFIAQLQPKEQMALVAFHSSAEMIQDFTSSKDALLRSLSTVKYGNAPQVLDALFAALDGGFQNSTFRRVILLLTAGIEGPSRVREASVVKLARRNAASIYPVFISGYERSLFRELAERTGGAPFNLRDMEKQRYEDPAAHIFNVIRSRYTLTLSGNLSLGENAKITLSRKGKFIVSLLPLD